MAKEIKAKRPPKTIKEKKFVKAYLETGNATEAVIAAGYGVSNRNNAKSIGSENLTKLDFSDHFEKAGLTDEVIAQNTTNIALRATRIVGTANDFIEVPDEPTKIKAMDFAVRLMGKMAPPKAAVDEYGNTVIPVLTMLNVHTNPE